MTTRTPRLQGRIRILVALGVASLALVVASPANAIYRDYEAPADEAPVIERVVNQANDDPPVDEDGKKSCYILLADGKGFYSPHGSTVILYNPKTDTSTTIRCNDGTWEPASQTGSGSGYYYNRDAASYYAGP